MKAVTTAPIAVITGGNVGIGKETARALVAKGYRVLIAARSRQRAETAIAEIASTAGPQAHQIEYLALDLADLASVRAATAQIEARCPRLDLLVANAGLIASPRSETRDGFETTFGVNHLGHFALIEGLRDRLTFSAPARVVIVASTAHKSSRGLDFDDLQRTKRRYGSWAAYCDSKLANVMFARELGRRLDGTGVVAHSLHPGFVNSEFGGGGDVGGALRPLLNLSKKVFAISPEKGAKTTIHVATSAEAGAVTGRYWSNSRLATPSKAALDDGAAKKLWEISESLTNKNSASRSRPR